MARGRLRNVQSPKPGPVGHETEKERWTAESKRRPRRSSSSWSSAGFGVSQLWPSSLFVLTELLGCCCCESQRVVKSRVWQEGQILPCSPQRTLVPSAKGCPWRLERQSNRLAALCSRLAAKQVPSGMEAGLVSRAARQATSVCVCGPAESLAAAAVNLLGGCARLGRCVCCRKR